MPLKRHLPNCQATYLYAVAQGLTNAITMFNVNITNPGEPRSRIILQGLWLFMDWYAQRGINVAEGWIFNEVQTKGVRSIRLTHTDKNILAAIRFGLFGTPVSQDGTNHITISCC